MSAKCAREKYKDSHLPRFVVLSAGKKILKIRMSSQASFCTEDERPAHSKTLLYSKLVLGIRNSNHCKDAFKRVLRSFNNYIICILYMDQI